MKLFTKIALAAALSLTLLTVPSTLSRETGRECAAQGMPTIDIQNLLMNIVDMVEQIMGIEEDLSQYAEKFQNLAKAIQVIQQMSKGVKFGMSVNAIMQDILSEGNHLMDCASYFLTLDGCSVETIAFAQGIPQMYSAATADIVDIIQDKLESYQDMSGYTTGKAMAADPLEIMRLVEEGMREARSVFYELTSSCELAMKHLYRSENMRRLAAQTEAFRSILVY